MAENIIVVAFGVESEAYQALSEMRHTAVNPGFVVSQASIIKKEDGTILQQDEFDTGVDTTDDTQRGGVIGALVGIVGGPLGVLLGGSMGTLIGGAVDTSDTFKNASLIEKVCECIPDGQTSLIALISEIDPLAIDLLFSKFSASITRFDAAEVAEEIEKAEELQRQLEKEARQKMREEKKENHKQKIEDRRAKMQADFDALKEKFSLKKD